VIVAGVCVAAEKLNHALSVGDDATLHTWMRLCDLLSGVFRRRRHWFLLVALVGAVMALRHPGAILVNCHAEVR